MISQRCSRIVRVLIVVTTLVLIVTPVVHADEIWVAATAQQDLGGLEVASNTIWPVTPIGAVRFVWAVPNNLQTFQSAKISLIPGGPAGAATLNVLVCTAQNGNLVAGTCAGPFAQAFTGVVNQLAEVEIGPAIASRVGTPGANYLAVLAYTTPTTTTDHIVGLRFGYAPTPPSGVPTLTSNTFTGTQTAPQFSGSFIGNGSGLTNLPVPSGVATLGTNNFTGTQVAPLFTGSFSGNGSGLTGVPIPTGVATLGANVFNGSQQIATGNLDLATSTSTSGNITKHGALFLHTLGPGTVPNNLFLGVNAGNLTVAAAGNTGVGYNALNAATTGLSNTAIGTNALPSNTTGQFNNAVGAGALFVNTTGESNVAVGESALVANVTGSNNTAIGDVALLNSSGDNNVAVGAQAGFNATTGSFNIYLGTLATGQAGESNTMYLGKVGTQTKTFIAGVRGITTVNNDAMPVVVDSAGQLGTAPISFSTLGANTFTGTQTAPAFVGDGAGLTNLPLPGGAATLNANTFGGTQSAPLFSGSFAGNGSALTNLPTPSGVATLGANSFTGTQSIQSGNLDLVASTPTSGNLTKNGALFLHAFGSSNTFLGVNAGNTTLTGIRNTATGANGLQMDTTGTGNAAFGAFALSSNTTGMQNTGTGHQALQSNTIGSNNTAHGVAALGSNSSGTQNTASGTLALGFNTDGSLNTSVGFKAGSMLTSGSNNIYLGANVVGVWDDSNTMYLGLQGTQTKTLIAGIRGVTTINNDAIPVMIDSAGQLGTISSSIRFKEDIHDMADMSQRLFNLRPVTFRYAKPYANGSKPIQFGLVAEEVAEVFPELAVRDANGNVETVHYETLNVLLLNEVQKQQHELALERAMRQDQQKRLEAIEQRLNDLMGEKESNRGRQ